MVRSGVRRIVRFGDLVNRDDVGVAEACEDLGFPGKAGRQLGGGQLGQEQLDGYGAVECNVMPKVHGAHSATGDFALERVLRRERPSQSLEKDGVRAGLSRHRAFP